MSRWRFASSLLTTLMIIAAPTHAASVAAPADDAPTNFSAVKQSWLDLAAEQNAAATMRQPDLVEAASFGDEQVTRQYCGGYCYPYGPPLICNGKLFGLIAQSDRDFYCFVSPQSNPLFFEDPRTLTELRFHFVNQWFSNSNPVFAGGTAQYAAVQARFALTKRLSVIATKDGYLWLNSNTPAVNSDGFADIAAGLKYNLIRNPARQFVLSSGFTYCFPSGAERVFQGNGNGEWHLFLSGGKELFGCAHWVSGAGLRLPNASDVQSKMWYWSNSFDVLLTKRVYALTQINWFHWFDSGNVLAADFEGNDLFNLGSTDVAGQSIVTASWGLRAKFGRYHETGVAYEIPVTQRKDLLESRVYFDLIMRY